MAPGSIYNGIPPDLEASLCQYAVSQRNSPAVTFHGLQTRSITYGELFLAASGAAAKLALEDARLRPCIVVSARSIDLVVMLVACLLCRRAVVTYDPRHGRQRLSHVIKSSGCSLVVGDAAGRSVAHAASGGVRTSNGVQVEAIEEYARLSSNVRLTCGPPSDCAEGAGSKAAVVLFTSGTTGSSKGVCISRDDLNNRVATEARWFGLQPQDTTLGILPLSFDVGLTQLLGALFSGGHHVLLQSWLPRDVEAAITRFSPVGLAATPFFWNRVLASGKGPARFGLEKLRYVTISGGPLAPEMVQTLSRALKPCGLFKTYGMTEMFRIASLRPDDVEMHAGSVGRAYPGVQQAILRGDGTECEAGEIGDIVAWGAGQMSGYLDSDESNLLRYAPSLRSDCHPVIFTGDRGWMDGQGFLYVVGRADGMIKILDQRVYPEEVANHVADILGLREVVAIPVQKGHAEPSFVVFHTTQKPNFSETQGLALLRSALPGHLVPRRLIKIDTMPYTSTGKYKQASLIDEATRILF